MRFSVIVPIYKVEKYINDCVLSVLNQTFTDFEVILVDDCSPDNCPSICDAFARQDTRVKVIHKEKNGWLSYARNTGLEVATGEYVIFLDGDDYLDKNTLDFCDRELKTNPADILTYGITLAYENKKGKIIKQEVLSAEKFYATGANARAFAMLRESRVFQYAWNKAYKREFLSTNGLIFENTKLIEDFLFNIKAFALAKDISVVSYPLYNYRKPPHETLASIFSENFFELVKRKYLLEKEFLQKFDSLNEYNSLIATDFVKHIVSTVIRNGAKNSPLNKKQQLEKLTAILNDDLTISVVNGFNPQGFVYKTLVNAIRKKNVKRVFFLVKLIKLIKNK